MTTGEQPKRVSRRWRIILILVSIVLMVLTLWLGADFAAEQQLAAQIARIRAAGEPVTEADLASNPPVADGDNAAFLYQRLRELKVDHPTLVDYLGDPDFRRARRAEVLKILQEDKDNLSLLRQARGCGRCDFKAGLGGSPEEMRYGPFWERAMLLCLAAVQAHDSGEDAAAIEYLLDALALGRSLDTPQAAMFAHLRLVSINSLAPRALEEVLPTLKISDGVGATRPEQVQGLQELLLDSEYAGQLRRSLLAERVWLLHMTLEATRERSIESMRLDTILWMQEHLLPRLFWKRDASLILEDATQAITAAGEANYPAIEAAWPKPREFQGLFYRFHPLFTGLVFIPSNHLPQIYLKVLAQRRMAGLALAMRRYEVAKGHRPEKLEDLVPAFLKEVPKDPWSGTGRAISWTKTAPARLYCVGLNGIDEGGAFTEQGKGIDSPDQVFFLDADRPFAKATSTSPTTAPDTSPAPASAPAPGAEAGE